MRRKQIKVKPVRIHKHFADYKASSMNTTYAILSMRLRTHGEPYSLWTY